MAENHSQRSDLDSLPSTGDISAIIPTSTPSSTDGSSAVGEKSAAVANDAAVGVLDPRQSVRRRQMLSVINNLRSTGAQLDLDLPVIAVIGSQSAGKSSLVESISGITLPRASGTCTRCPTECLLSQSDGPWSCSVSLRLVTDAKGVPLDHPKNVDFGDPILDKADVTERIRRAQLAILNPGHDHQRYLEGVLEDDSAHELSFSSNSVCLRITGKDLEDLSFVDLPGLIVGGNAADRELVQKLAETYISKPSCIILLTVACETDFVNQHAHLLAEQYDPNGARTIGVLTKPDRIPKGEESSWINLLDNGSKSVDYFCIKNPGSHEIKNGITWEQSRDQEREFFEATVPWATLDLHHSQKLGTHKLTARLGKSLTDLIIRRLPQLQDELEKLLEITDSLLNRLPPPPSSEPLAEILQMVGRFAQTVERQTAGVSSKDGLLQSLRPLQLTFQRAIRATAPDFRPFEKPGPGEAAPAMPTPLFLANEGHAGDFEPADDGKAIWIDDVMARAQAAVTRELPGNYPFVVKKELIVSIVSKWGSPADALFLVTNQALRKRLLEFIDEQFGQFTVLKQRMITIVTEHLRDCANITEASLRQLQEMEKSPFTRNEHYLADYREKFLTHYKALRRQDSNNFVSQLDGLQDESEDFEQAVSTAMASIQSLGFHDFRPEDIPRLLPPDRFEPAIEIMADVRAYIQVAYKRYVDNVPMFIDFNLITGVNNNLVKKLYAGLGVGGDHAFERCQQLLEEPADVCQRRDQLVKRRERLRRARAELLEAFA